MTFAPRAFSLLHDYLSDSAWRAPDKVALVCRGERLTYADIEARSNALAHSLIENGVARGDRVIVLLENGVEAVIAFWAVLKANAVVSMVNPQTKSDKLLYLLEDCRASALVSDARLASVFAGPASRSPYLKVVVLAGGAHAPLGTAGRVLPFAEGTHGDGRAPPPRLAIDIDLASIIYTSGSTGQPKGVMMTHRNMMTAATSISTYIENFESDVIVNVLPLAFDYGLYQMIMAFRVGARLVLERSFAYPIQVLNLMVEEQVTGFPGVPTIFALLSELETLSSFDFSHIRYVTNTAAALPVKHITMLQGLFPKARIYSMYGLTECKRCTYLPPEDLTRKPESVGIAIPNTELWVVGEDGERLGPDRVGELVIRGATVMRGYWEKPLETAEKLKPGPLPGELVLYTGDYGRLDAEGYLYFVGRKDDIIKSRGEKVAPKEVESAIVDIPGVKQAAVVGVPDPILGQAVKAFVVLEKGATLTPRDIEGECARRLEGFMVPKHIELRDELPVTTTGKVTKTGLA